MNLDNIEAVKLLESEGYSWCHSIVATLIKGGFIEADVTEPEKIAKKVKNWLRLHAVTDPEMILDRATGWDTFGWNEVLGESTTISMRKDIFRALQILAEEVKN